MPAIRKIVYASAPDQPIFDFRTIDEVATGSMAAGNIAIMLLGIFAALALLLSSAGICGVVSYSIMRRTQKIGIRMALGGDRSWVVGMIPGQGTGMASGSPPWWMGPEATGVGFSNSQNRELG
jgi:ABC-type antimicrobial peptide transport system permease subunit